MAVERYHAFITYSHQDNRRERATGAKGCVEWGIWIHETLETYRIPPAIRARDPQNIPERLYPVFRDEAELPISSDLGKPIREALHASKFLIVVCSPRSAVSRYCNEEVRYFKSLGRRDRILSLIVDGEPNATEGNKPGIPRERECFMPALRHPLLPDGTLDTGQRDAEPIYGDARMGHDKREPDFKTWKEDQDRQQRVLLKLVAGLLGVGYGELIQRDQQRQLEEEKQRAAPGA